MNLSDKRKKLKDMIQEIYTGDIDVQDVWDELDFQDREFIQELKKEFPFTNKEVPAFVFGTNEKNKLICKKIDRHAGLDFKDAKRDKEE